MKAAMQAGYVEKKVDEAAAKLEAAKYRRMREIARFGVAMEDMDEQEARYDPERTRQQAESNKVLGFKQYEELLDWEAKTRIQDEFKTLDERTKEEMEKREPDHPAWLDNDQLEYALDLYDREQPVWGQAFAAQIALCVLGMSSCRLGETQLSAWWADTTIAKRNWIWRAVTRNQAEIEKETRLALAKAQADQALTADNMVEMLETTSTWFERVADLLTKADAAVDAGGAAGAPGWFNPRRLGLVLSLLAAAQQYLFRLLPANAADRYLLGPLLGFIHSNLGRATTNLRMRDLAAAGQTANRNRVAGQVNSHITRVRNQLNAEFQQGGGGKFYQLRGGVILAILEGIILATKSSKRNEGEKERMEYTAALLITSAAGIELAAIGVQSVTARYAPNAVVGRGAAVVLGGLRLVGGTMAAAGGAMLAIVDFKDGKKSFDKKTQNSWRRLFLKRSRNSRNLRAFDTSCNLLFRPTTTIPSRSKQPSKNHSSSRAPCRPQTLSGPLENYWYRQLCYSWTKYRDRHAIPKQDGGMVLAQLLKKTHFHGHSKAIQNPGNRARQIV